MYYRYLEFASYVKGGTVEPHWMADGNIFWYAEGAPENTVIWKIDPVANTKEPMFDIAGIREALTEILGHEMPGEGLPFKDFEFLEGQKGVSFSVEGQYFQMKLDTYEITKTPAHLLEEKENRVPKIVGYDAAGHPYIFEVPSPDGRWFAGIKNNDLWLREAKENSNDQLTTDGKDLAKWSVEGAKWSADSTRFALQKLNYNGVPMIPIVDWLGAMEEVDWVPVQSSFSRTKAGQPLPGIELYIVDVASRTLTQVDTGKEPDQHVHIIGWRNDGSELLFLRASRTLRKLELMAANPNTGVSRVLLIETQESFVYGINLFLLFESIFRQVDSNGGFIWMSEKDDWNHLYHYDFHGTLVNRLTEGKLPVGGIEGVDDKRSFVYFSRPEARERPYDKHLYRVSLTGKGMAQLTEGSGQHDIQFSPSMQFFLDTHSSLDIPPVTYLRRADGTLVQTLTKADISALEELEWNPPEEFVVKAADGKTDLYGVLYKPFDFDLNKKYPVIDSVYGCPQMNYVPRRFSDWRGLEEQALAQLGFIVFKVDARGTPKRGKDFQDAIYRKMGRLEVEDHKTTLKHLANTRPYMDLTRVGITGHSCGGYFTIRALLQAPEVYHVGVAKAPIADLYYGNAMEVYMGLPEENREAYEYASNLPLAGNLEGKLLMVHGTHDFSVPLSQTIRMGEAFIRAGKYFDLLVLPGQDHFYWYEEEIDRYVQDATRRYFVEHLKP